MHTWMEAQYKQWPKQLGAQFLDEGHIDRWTGRADHTYMTYNNITLNEVSLFNKYFDICCV